MFAFDPYLKPLNQTADLLGTELLNPETAAMLACPAMTRPLCLDLCHFLANSVELQLHLVLDDTRWEVFSSRALAIDSESE